MATKTPRARAKKEPKVLDNSLLLALQFVNAAQRETGTLQQTHCVLRDHWAVASDSVMTLGHPIADDLAACPQTKRLIDALGRCAEGFSVTQHDADRLSVKAGGFRVAVPCIDLADVPVFWADPVVAPIDGRFTDACRAIAHLSTEGAQRVVYASLLMCGQSVVATNGTVIAEAWHGIDLPPAIVMPKASIAALLKIDKKLTGFGCSDRSITFHFEDKSWLKTQCYQDKWPDFGKVLNSAPTGVVLDVPPGLFEAVNKLAPFANANRMRFIANAIEAVTNDKDTAEHDVPDVIAGSVFGVKDLQAIAPLALTLDTVSSPKMGYFFGNAVRGAIAKVND